MTETATKKKPIPVKKAQPQQKRKHKPTAPAHSARTRCTAVLSVWTERRRPSEICRELDIRGQVLNQWQNRAMEGMMQALQPRVNLEMGPALPSRLQRFLAKRLQTKAPAGNMPARLEDRLQKIQSEAA